MISVLSAAFERMFMTSYIISFHETMKSFKFAPLECPNNEVILEYVRDTFYFFGDGLLITCTT